MIVKKIVIRNGCITIKFAQWYISNLRTKKDLNTKIPLSINYNEIAGLSKESCVALEKARPANLASASRIPGFTPAALTSVLLYTKKSRGKKIA